MITAIALGVLGVAAGLCLMRLLLGSTTADRIVALDSILVTIVSALAVWTLRTGEGAYLAVAFIAALVAFSGTVAVARYIEQRGDRPS